MIKSRFKLALSKFVIAAGIYAGSAVYLYQPHFKHFNTQRYLLLVNVCLASLGCYVLSRRWITSFWGSLFGGAIYGFGPFALGLAGYHPTAGFLAAAIPWLFCPAAFGPRVKWQWLQVPLSALPFLVIVLFFQTARHYRLFAIPIHAKLQLVDLVGLLAPLVMTERSLTLIGFYHVPIALLVMGFSMLLAARRFGIIVVFCLGIILAVCDSIFYVSPIIWLAIPVLCCSVLIGAGLQGLVSAGFTDRRWVLMTTVIMAVLSAVTLLLAIKYAAVFVETTKMYILGAIAAAFIFFVARAKLRIQLLRLVLLCSAMAVDIFFGARFIVDKIF